MVLDKLKCCRHHTIVESDLTAKHLEWQIAKKKKIKDKDYILTHPPCHSTVRKIVLMKGVKQSRRVSCREKKKRYFFWFSSWKINHHHSFTSYLMYTLYDFSVYRPLFSTYIVAYYIFHLFISITQNPGKIIMTLKTIIFFFISFVCTIKIWKLW